MKICEKCGKQYDNQLTKCLYCGHMNKEDVEKNKAQNKKSSLNRTQIKKQETIKEENKDLEVSKEGKESKESGVSGLDVLLSEDTVNTRKINLDRTQIIIGLLSLTALAFAGSTYYMYSLKEKTELAHAEDLKMMDSVLDELITTEETLEEANGQIELLKSENDKLTLKLDSLISGVGEEGRSVYDFGSIYYIKNKEFDNVYPIKVQGETVVVEMNNYLFSVLDDSTLEYMIRFYLSEYKKVLNSLNNEFMKLTSIEEVNAKVKEVINNKEIYKNEYGNKMSLLELDKFMRALVGNATTREFNYIKNYVDEYNNLSKWKNTITNPVSEIEVFKMNIEDLKKNVDKNGYSESLSKNSEAFKPVVPKTAIERLIEGSACSDIINYVNDNKVTVDVVESSIYVCLTAYESYLNNLAGITKANNLDIKYKESLSKSLKVTGLPEGISFLDLKDTIEWLLISGKKAGYRLYGFENMKKSLDEMHINVLTRPTTYTQNGRLKDKVVKDIENVNTQTYKLLEGKEEYVSKLISSINDMYTSYKTNIAQLQSNNPQ